MAAATCWVRKICTTRLIGGGSSFGENEFLIPRNAEPIIGTVEFDDDFPIPAEDR